jgi:DNA ligase (NAD+)
MVHGREHFQDIFLETLTDVEVESTYQDLVETIVYHNRLYYELGTSEISDGEYDELFALLCAIEKEHPELMSPSSPTKQV